MHGKFLLFGRDKIENSLMGCVDRKIGEQRRDEQRLAERQERQDFGHASLLLRWARRILGRRPAARSTS